MRVASDAPAGDYQLRCMQDGGALGDGTALAPTCGDGIIHVEQVGTAPVASGGGGGGCAVGGGEPAVWPAAALLLALLAARRARRVSGG